MKQSDIIGDPEYMRRASEARTQTQIQKERAFRAVMMDELIAGRIRLAFRGANVFADWHGRYLLLVCGQCFGATGSQDGPLELPLLRIVRIGRAQRCSTYTALCLRCGDGANPKTYPNITEADFLRRLIEEGIARMIQAPPRP